MSKDNGNGVKLKEQENSTVSGKRVVRHVGQGT